MLLVCPSCETAFRVENDALAPPGRNVRCARCKNMWFAEPPQAVEPAAPEHTADLYVFPTALPAPPIVGDDIVIWETSAPADDAMLAPSQRTDAGPEQPAASPERTTQSAWRNLSWRGTKEPRRGAGPALATATVVLGCIIVAALIAPTAYVRMMPGLAGLYAAAGMPVNVRGLEFRELRTTRELHDGVALLVTEGRVANVSGRELELPAIRLAALGANGRELYAWSATAARPSLADGGTVAFKSRLASPPADAENIQVRFMSRSDLAWVYR